MRKMNRGHHQPSHHAGTQARRLEAAFGYRIRSHNTINQQMCIPVSCLCVIFRPPYIAGMYGISCRALKRIRFTSKVPDHTRQHRHPYYSINYVSKLKIQVSIAHVISCSCCTAAAVPQIICMRIVWLMDIELAIVRTHTACTIID